ncbi:undecaprenyldiphospho-muramoylpentapeptide beta-N-acetylglucosaminyltransferase [Rhodospirillaceae bacterium SYSU D60014]|uniref:undecaprenyldiphospho-muramoylpentapeptide beta-N-acetylglucosaminyltransferase n=1 Tax=Virgifigura deserti TaxID=2268457 RepID=UPI000E6728C6
MTAARTDQALGKVLLAAGGTGGHMFPAEALAGELLARGFRVALITDRRGRGFGDRLPAVETHHISAGGLSGGTVIRRAKGAFKLAVGLLQARRMVTQLAPDVAVGFGGYPSVPTMLAAGRAGLPTILHEQNAVLGRANRLLARRATRIATSFPAIEAAIPLDPGKLALTGNPVRPGIAALADQPYPTLQPGSPIMLLILGGSQGARIFGRVMPSAIARLPRDLRTRLRITQQCRVEDLEAARAAYAHLGLKAELATFFDDIPARLAAAHLVVARSGASTVAEVTAAGRPAILVPYPFATDDHQTANAKAISDVGGAWLMPERALTPETLAERLQAVLSRPETLTQTADAARKAAHCDAAIRLADLVVALMPENGADRRARRSDADNEEVAA